LRLNFYIIINALFFDCYIENIKEKSLSDKNINKIDSELVSWEKVEN
jgi:hypothetical protein